MYKCECSFRSQSSVYSVVCSVTQRKLSKLYNKQTHTIHHLRVTRNIGCNVSTVACDVNAVRNVLISDVGIHETLKKYSPTSQYSTNNDGKRLFIRHSTKPLGSTTANVTVRLTSYQRHATSPLSFTIAANWTFWQCRGHLKTHTKPALTPSLCVISPLVTRGGQGVQLLRGQRLRSLYLAGGRLCSVAGRVHYVRVCSLNGNQRGNISRARATSSAHR